MAIVRTGVDVGSNGAGSTVSVVVFVGTAVGVSTVSAVLFVGAATEPAGSSGSRSSR